MSVSKKEFLAAVALTKDSAIADACGVGDQAVSQWGTRGIPQERILDYIEACGFGLYRMADQVVMEEARAHALELLAAEALKKGRAK